MQKEVHWFAAMVGKTLGTFRPKPCGFQSHSLRASRCTHLLQHGVDAAVIRRHVSYHQKEDTFMAYIGRMSSEKISWDECFFNLLLKRLERHPRWSGPIADAKAELELELGGSES